MRLRVALLSLVTLGGVACVPPEPEVNLGRAYDELTVMGEIQERGHVVIGIADDAYPLGYVDQNDQAQGFSAELGRRIAETLDVEARFITGTSDQLLDLPQEGTADIVFPAVTITEELVDSKYQFSDPYFISHQRLLAPSQGFRIIDSVEQLEGETVCAIGSEETQVSFDTFEHGIEVVNAEPLQCLHFLERADVAAITGPDFLLAGLRLGNEEEFAIVGDQLTTEGIGAVIERGASGWVDFVNAVFEEAEEDGLWASAFRDSIGQGLEVAAEPPEITAEEAAALYPSGV